jgi:hypothetical protein
MKVTTIQVIAFIVFLAVAIYCNIRNYNNNNKSKLFPKDQIVSMSINKRYTTLKASIG